MRITTFHKSSNSDTANAVPQKTRLSTAVESLGKRLANTTRYLKKSKPQTSSEESNRLALSMLKSSFKIGAVKISEFVQPESEAQGRQFLIQKTGINALSTYRIENAIDKKGNRVFKAVDMKSNKVVAENDFVEGLRTKLSRKLTQELLQAEAFEELGDLIKYHTDWDGFKETIPQGRKTEFFSSDDESTSIYVQRIDDTTFYPVLIQNQGASKQEEKIECFELQGSQKIKLPGIETFKQLRTFMNNKFAESLVQEPGSLKHLRVGEYMESAPAPSRLNFIILKKGGEKFGVLRLQTGFNESGYPRKQAVDIQSDKVVAMVRENIKNSVLAEYANKNFFPTYHKRNPVFVDTSPSKNIPLTFSYLAHVAGLNTQFAAIPKETITLLERYGGIITPENETQKDGNASERYGAVFARIESELIEKSMARCTPGSALFTSMDKLKANLIEFSKNAVEFDFSFKLNSTAEIEKTTTALFDRISNSAHFAMPLIFQVAESEEGFAHVTTLAFTKNPDGTFDIEFMNRGYGVNHFHDRVPSSKSSGAKYKTVKVYRGIELTAQANRPGALGFDVFSKLIGYANSTMETAAENKGSTVSFGEGHSILSNLASFHALLDSLTQNPESSSLPLQPIIQAPQKDANCGYSSMRSYMRTLLRSSEMFAQMEYLSKTELLAATRQFVQDAAPLAAKDAKVNANVALVESTTLPAIQKKIEQAQERVLNLAMQSPSGSAINEIAHQVIKQKLAALDPAHIDLGSSYNVVDAAAKTLLFHRISENKLTAVVVEQQTTLNGQHYIAHELSDHGPKTILAQGISLEEIKAEMKNYARYN
ncbi:hypothetical protein [Limnobacter parvus]|uniref:Uncharacterized protein n=1 Tax=Limnobacter parvus TaxID=2939690 RepID=A0ABT1XCQ9_9BURK|nr:hypothetical protein [Limnobacter parvus]MCR2745065.1 hypothetical protein [Limnobacter parvus]